MKPQDLRKPAAELDDEIDRDVAPARPAQGEWFQRDPRTLRLASLVGGGYSLLTVEIVYTAKDTPEQRQTAVWEGFDIEPGFGVFRTWLAAWEARDGITVVDLSATSRALVCEQELALNPRILLVH